MLTRRDHASAIGRRRAALARHPSGEKRAEEWCELLVPIEEPQPQTPAEVAVALNPAWAVVLRPHLDPRWVVRIQAGMQFHAGPASGGRSRTYSRTRACSCLVLGPTLAHIRRPDPASPEDLQDALPTRSASMAPGSSDCPMRGWPRSLRHTSRSASRGQGSW
jgi:hypothetical protein